MDEDLLVYVRRADLSRIGQIDDWEEFSADLFWTGTGNWSLTMSAQHPLVPELWMVGAGILVKYKGKHLISGPIRSFRRKSNESDGDVLVIGGPDDSVVLNERRAEPCEALGGRPLWEGRLADADNRFRYFVQAKKYAEQEKDRQEAAAEQEGSGVEVDPALDERIKEADAQIPLAIRDREYWTVLIAGRTAYEASITTLDNERRALLEENRVLEQTGDQNARQEIDQNNTRITEIGEIISDLTDAANRSDRGVIEDLRYPTASHDRRTGAIETIMKGYVLDNLGDGRDPSRWAQPLTVQKDQRRGREITYEVRFEQVKDVLDALSVLGDDMGYAVVQNGTSLEFQTQEAIDSSASMIFSQAWGTVGDFEYSIEAPPFNDVLVAGQGDLTERTFVRGRQEESIANWGLIEAPLKDQRDTNEKDQLILSVDEELASATSTRSFTLVAQETEGRQWRRDWDLGHKVTVRFGHGTYNHETEQYASTFQYQDLVRQVRLTWSASEPLKVEPTIGSPDALRPDVLEFIAQQRKINKDMSTITRT